jgi:uncharacterized protein YlaI
MRPNEIVKCPHCGKDPTSAPVTAGELTCNLQSDEVATYICEECEHGFSVEERMRGPRPFHYEVIVKDVGKP